MPYSDPVVEKTYFQEYYQKNKSRIADYYQANKEHKKAYMKKWRAENKIRRKLSKQTWDSNNIEHRREYQKKFMLENKETQRNLAVARGLKKRYGITIEQYTDMFNRQKGYCAICGVHQINLKRKLCVDHNHDTSKVRELLCNRCNFAIGFLEQSEQRRKSIFEYLKKHEGKTL